MTADLWRNQRGLMVAGVVSLCLFLIMTLLNLVDPVEILGVNRWIKPAKFYFSITIYLATIAVFLHFLKSGKRFTNIISWGIIVTMAIEMIAITGQPLRGTTSHFNNGNLFNETIFTIMGIAILINTLLVAAILYRYFTNEIDLPPSVVLGMRLGLVIFLIGSVQGGYMASQIGHTVGSPDGGPGLPIANWSTVSGDLRVAHFLGLHALQLIPIFAFGLERFKVGARTAIIFAFALFYVGIFGYTFAEALQGKPFISF